MKTIARLGLGSAALVIAIAGTTIPATARPTGPTAAASAIGLPTGSTTTPAAIQLRAAVPAVTGPPAVLPTVTGSSAVVPASTAGQGAASSTVARNRAAQTRLTALGCRPGPIDGRLGAMTQAATVRFQSANAIAQSGLLTSATYSRLMVASAKRCDVRPVPAGSGTGRRIVLSQGQNWVWLVDAAGRVVRSDGMIDNPSYLRPGTYSTGPKCGRPARIQRNSDGGRLYLNNFVRFAPCGIGFHQIPTYKSGGAQIHADWLLGTNSRASHGCIRVSRSMSAAIWAYTVAGTKVVVTR
jgi:peptidoglycan hydrolase-like protein with peptidoglycan-binding domain